MSAKFGPAGNSDAFSAVHKSSLAAPQWIAEQDINAARGSMWGRTPPGG